MDKEERDIQEKQAVEQVETTLTTPQVTLSQVETVEVLSQISKISSILNQWLDDPSRTIDDLLILNKIISYLNGVSTSIVEKGQSLFDNVSPSFAGKSGYGKLRNRTEQELFVDSSTQKQIWIDAGFVESSNEASNGSAVWKPNLALLEEVYESLDQVQSETADEAEKQE